MPFLFGNEIFLVILKELLESENNPIKYVYGNVSSKWSGGRLSFINIKDVKYIDDYLTRLEKYNVIPSITFSNHLLTKSDLRDKFCNQLLDVYIKHNARFIITSELLYEHIKKRNKKANMVCSVILPSILKDNSNFDETLFYQRMLEKFDTVVLRPEWTIDHVEDISTLLKDIERVEVLANQCCKPNCPRSKEHYELFLDSKKAKELKYFCPLSYKDERPLFFSNEIIKKLINKGVKQIKLQGRDYSFNRIYNDLYSLFFNNELYSQDKIRTEIDKISAEIIQNNKKLSFNIL